MSKLIEIQQKLNAPKDKFNSFGKYKYRSAEGILHAVKPLLDKAGLTLTLTDEAVQVGQWVFIKATAQIRDGETVIAETSAFARHEDEKKGMDASQVSGACSSYARKYALGGLFMIDDAQDSDATNTHMQTADRADGQKIAAARKAAGLDAQTVSDMMRQPPFSCENPPNDLLKIHVPKLLDMIKSKGGKNVKPE